MQFSPARALRFQYSGLMFLLLAGAAIGASAGRAGKAGGAFFSAYLQGVMTAGAAANGFFSLAAASFFPAALLLCGGCLFGFCAVGLPLELCLPVLQGVLIGSGMAGIYIKYGANGLGICAAFLLPQAVLSSLSVLVASREGIRLSGSIALTVFRGNRNPAAPRVRAYCFKFVVCFAILMAASAVQALTLMLFAKIFLSP